MWLPSSAAGWLVPCIIGWLVVCQAGYGLCGWLVVLLSGLADGYGLFGWLAGCMILLADSVAAYLCGCVTMRLTSYKAGLATGDMTGYVVG